MRSCPRLRSLRAPSAGRLLLAGALFLWALSGCASTYEGGGRGERNRISQEELQSSAYASAYEAVERLRPRWLVVRGDLSPNTADPVMAYVDGTRFGPAEALRQMSAENIASMRFLPAAEATARHGRGNRNGVIEVETRSGQ